MNWTAKEIALLRSQYPVHGPKNLASAFGRPWGSIYCKSRKLGIKVLLEHKYDRNFLTNDVSAFITCRTPQVAYLLGLCWADGHLRKVNSRCRGYILSLALKTEDFETVRPVIMRSSPFWKIYTEKARTTALITSRELHQYLARMDFFNKSISSPSKLLNNIPIGIRHYFWRGFFDGDGYISCKPSAKTVIICGHIRQNWKDWVLLLRGQRITNSIQRVRTPSGNCSRLRISRILDIASLGKYLLAGKQFGLSRKHIKFSQIMPLAA